MYRTKISLAKTDSKGFTLLELLLVGIVICILTTLVALTYSGIQATNRNAERRESINSLQRQLEVYYAQYDRYPLLTDLNNTEWRNQNTKTITAEELQDPRWNEDIKACTVSGKSVVTAKAAENCYSYEVTSADGSVCDNNTIICTRYTLTTLFEGGDKYVKSSLN